MRARAPKTKMLERTIKLAVKRRLKQVGAYQHWPVQMGMGEPTLDCIGCYLGLYFAVETKRPGGKVTRLQQVTIDRIQAANGLALVIDSLEAANALFSDNPPPLAKTTRTLRANLRVVAGRADG